MAFRTGKLVLSALLATGAIAVLLFKHQAYARLRDRNQALRIKLEQADRLLDEHQRLRALTADLRQDSPDRLKGKLARLRREAEPLQAQKEEWEQLRTENRQLRADLGDRVRPLISKADWTYVGYGDPESAAQSSLWASLSGDPTAILESIMPEEVATWTNCSEKDVAAFCEKLNKSTEKMVGFQILGQKQISDDEVEVIMNL